MKTKSAYSFAKWTVYALILAATAVLQSLVNTNINLGIKLNIIPYLLTAVVMYEHLYMSVAASLVCGMASDFLSPATDGVFMLVYGVCGVCIWVLSRRKFRRIFSAFLILGSGTLLVGCAGLYAYYIIDGIYAPLGQSLIMVLGRLIFSALLSPIMYFPIRSIHYKFR